MNKIVSFGLALSTFLISACGNKTTTKEEAAENSNKVADVKYESNTKMQDAEEKTYAVSLVNNKKDPTCGMPVTAGIHDTAHYEKYVVGFCSKECKDEFLKNPKAGLAAAELTK